jgi:two-component system NarL family response regulator
MNSRIRVLCVDDHRVMLDGLSLLIGRQNNMSVVATTTNGEDAIALFRTHRPRITLMDLRLPTIDGVETIRRIRTHDPEARIVVLTMYEGDEAIFRALDAGAAAYVLKDVISEDLIRVIRQVDAGEYLAPESITTRLEARKDLPALTPRETEVVRLIAEGMRNKEIAFTLNISEGTAKIHVKNILAKLKVHDRSAVVAVALRRGILRFG